MFSWFVAQQINTAMEFTKELRNSNPPIGFEGSISKYHLPDPPGESEFTLTCQAHPDCLGFEHKGQQSSVRPKIREGWLPFISQWRRQVDLNPMKDWSEERWEQFEKEPLSLNFFAFNSSLLHDGPLRCASFGPYRKFGFALWDENRMAVLGFLSP